MAEATLTDTTLSIARALVDKQSEGYYWVEGFVFGTRLNRLGENSEQLCLPAQYRGKCLTMAHEHFGHPGRNKMGDHIRKFFYWPSITADSIKHVGELYGVPQEGQSKPKAHGDAGEGSCHGALGKGGRGHCGALSYFQGGFQIPPDLSGHGNQVAGGNPPSEDDHNDAD